MPKRKLPEALKAHQFKKGGKDATKAGTNRPKREKGLPKAQPTTKQRSGTGFGRQGPGPTVRV